MTDFLSKLPSSVKIMEVGPRDGLQNEKNILDTQSKIRFIEDLVDAGVSRIEVSAFVSPKWIPPLADHVEVALGIKKNPHTRYAALVPNMRGYERALSANIDEVSVVVAASKTHNQKNLNGDTEQVMARYQEIAKRAREDNCSFRAYVSCAFGCPYEGPTDKKMVAELAQKLLDLGAYEIALSDTIGVASPISTSKVLEETLKYIKKEQVALHMHDTRGGALANILVALSMGVASFDAAAGGLGGCPYAPGASGNVATEDLVYMLTGMGIETGISLDKLAKATLQMEKNLGKKVPSKVVATYRSEIIPCVS